MFKYFKEIISGLFKGVVIAYLGVDTIYIINTNPTSILNEFSKVKTEMEITRSYFQKVITLYKKQILNLIITDVEVDKSISALQSAIANNEAIIKQLVKKKDVYTADYDKLQKANYLIFNSSDIKQGSGSLIKIENKYYILTCNHLLTNDTDFIFAKDTITNEIYPLELIKTDKVNDLALFRIYIEQFKRETPIIYLEVAEEYPKVGSNIYVIGNPSGHLDILTSGIIASIQKATYIITAKVFFGNSGGAMIFDGKLAGVSSQINTIISLNIDSNYIPRPISENYGIMINLETIKNFLKELI